MLVNSSRLEDRTFVGIYGTPKETGILKRIMEVLESAGLRASLDYDYLKPSALHRASLPTEYRAEGSTYILLQTTLSENTVAALLPFIRSEEARANLVNAFSPAKAE